MKGMKAKRIKFKIGSLWESPALNILLTKENDAVNTLFDPAHGKYWRLYNELEAKQSSRILKMSIKKSLMSIPNDNLQQLTTEINYA